MLIEALFWFFIGFSSAVALALYALTQLFTSKTAANQKKIDAYRFRRFPGGFPGMNRSNASASNTEGELDHLTPIPFGEQRAPAVAAVPAEEMGFIAPQFNTTARQAPEMVQPGNRNGETRGFNLRESINTRPVSSQTQVASSSWQPSSVDSPSIQSMRTTLDTMSTGRNVDESGVIKIEGWGEMMTPSKFSNNTLHSDGGSNTNSPHIRSSGEHRWKLRYFKLLGSQLVYFKGNPNDPEEMGSEVDSDGGSSVGTNDSSYTFSRQTSAEDTFDSSSGARRPHHFKRLRGFVHRRLNSEGEANGLVNMPSENVSSPRMSRFEELKSARKKKRNRYGFIQINGCKVELMSINAETRRHFGLRTSSDTDGGLLLEVYHPTKQHIFYVSSEHQKEKITRSRAYSFRMRMTDPSLAQRWFVALSDAGGPSITSTPTPSGLRSSFTSGSPLRSSMDEHMADYSKHTSDDYVSDASLELINDPSTLKGGSLRLLIQNASKMAMIILRADGKMYWYSIPVRSTRSPIGVFRLNRWDLLIHRASLTFELSNNSKPEKTIYKDKGEAKMARSEASFMFRSRDEDDFDRWVHSIGTFTKRISILQNDPHSGSIPTEVWEESEAGAAESCNWLNLLLSRNFQDMQNSSTFFNHVQEKIQKRLDTAGRPEWLGSIKIVDMNIGSQAPKISNIRLQPSSVPGELKGEIALEYTGGFSFALQSSVVVSIGKTFTLPISFTVTMTRLIGRMYIYASPILMEPCTAFFAEQPVVDFKTHVEVNESVFANRMPKFTEFLETTLRKSFFDRTVYPNRMIFNLPFPGRKMKFATIKTGKPSRYPRREKLDPHQFNQEYQVMCRDIVNRFTDMWSFGSFTSVFELFAEDSQILGLVGHSSEIRGKDNIRLYLRNFRSCFVGNASMQSSDLVVNNDFVCCKLSVHGLLTKPFWEFRATEHTNAVYLEATCVCRMKAAQIHQIWLSWTPATIMQYCPVVDGAGGSMYREKQ